MVKGLLDSLEQEESDLEVELGADAKDLLGQEFVVAGKKIKVAAATDEIDDLDEMEYDDDDDDWDDLTAVTAVAMEKEIAVEVIADVLTHTRSHFVPYFEKTIETVMGLVEHSYEGVRKAAISTLWRAYACLFGLMEDHTGQKWTPGLPLKSQPSEEVLKLGEVVTVATLSLWDDETDRYDLFFLYSDICPVWLQFGCIILSSFCCYSVEARTNNCLTLCETILRPPISKHCVNKLLIVRPKPHPWI